MGLDADLPSLDVTRKKLVSVELASLGEFVLAPCSSTHNTSTGQEMPQLEGVFQGQVVLAPPHLSLFVMRKLRLGGDKRWTYPKTRS